MDEHSQIQGQKQVRPTLKSTPLKFLCLFLLGRYELEGSFSFFASQAHLPVLSVRLAFLYSLASFRAEELSLAS